MCRPRSTAHGVCLLLCTHATMHEASHEPPDSSAKSLPATVKLLGWASLLNDVASGNMIAGGLAYGRFNCALGIATLPASLIFGWLCQAHGALAAFGFGTPLAVIAALIAAIAATPRSSEPRPRRTVFPLA